MVSYINVTQKNQKRKFNSSTFLNLRLFNILAPVTVSDCTANQDADCAENTNGKTKCKENVCSGKYQNLINTRLSFCCKD